MMLSAYLLSLGAAAATAAKAATQNVVFIISDYKIIG